MLGCPDKLCEWHLIKWADLSGALQASQPIREPSATEDEDYVEFERECIARAVADVSRAEPSVYFLGETTCNLASRINMTLLSSTFYACLACLSLCQFQA